MNGSFEIKIRTCAVDIFAVELHETNSSLRFLIKVC